MTPAAQPSAPAARRGGPEARGAARRLLLDAGLEVFGTSGYATSPIPDLCLRLDRGVDRTRGLALVGAANELLVERALTPARARLAIDDLVATLSALTLGALREGPR